MLCGFMATFFFLTKTPSKTTVTEKKLFFIFKANIQQYYSTFMEKQQNFNFAQEESYTILLIL